MSPVEVLLIEAAGLLRDGATIDGFVGALDGPTRTALWRALGGRVRCADGTLCRGEGAPCHYPSGHLSCSRPADHEGPHVACGETAHDLAAWGP
jgi:hypothetical protein